MWQHKQEERELKRVEGDIIKNQRAVRHTLRDYENGRAFYICDYIFIYLKRFVVCIFKKTPKPQSSSELMFVLSATLFKNFATYQ